MRCTEKIPLYVDVPNSQIIICLASSLAEYPRHPTWRPVHCKKRLSIFPSTAGMLQTKLSLAGKIDNLFYTVAKIIFPSWAIQSTMCYGIELSYRPNSLCSLTNRYDNPIPLPNTSRAAVLLKE
jgi:hypothetical protein